MAFEKGHTYGKGNHNSGRKTKEQEFKDAIEHISQEALIKLANSKVHKALKNAEDLKDIKDLGLPITLKGMTERKEVKLEMPKPIIDIKTKDDGVQEDNSDKQDNTTEQEG